MNNVAPRNTKLISLLSLSAGAVGLPHLADAEIFYSGVIDQNVGYSGGFTTSFTLDLPGAGDLQLFNATPAPYTTTAVELGNNAYGRVRTYGGSGSNAAFAKRSGAGATWDMIGGASAANGRIGERANGTGGGTVGPGSFSNSYVAFKFQDTTAGGAERYGWAYLSMTVGTGVGPDVTLHSYAYDSSGAKIAMGATAIPEPGTSAAIAAFGALALGGVRRWRAAKKSRAATVAA